MATTGKAIDRGNGRQIVRTSEKPARGIGDGKPLFAERWLNPAGRNKRSVWTVATAPYPEAHFATYPPDLIKPCILAGTSAKGCCAKCGAPWKRVVDVNYTKTQETNKPHKISRLEGAGEWIRMRKNCETVGWQPTCECIISEDFPAIYNTYPCTILDPFAGSGTTGAVAIELGRKAILIELNPKYVALINRRCSVTPGLALA